MTLIRAIRLSLTAVLSLSAFFSAAPSFAFIDNAKAPICFTGSKEIAVDNAQALEWKFNTENQFKARAYVKGTLVGEVWSENSHYHWIIKIGPGEKDVLEIIYNKEFGSMPELKAGDEMSVCGDFINSFARGGGYEASPAGALIHWIHYNPGDRGTSHEHGFVMVGDQLVGFDDADTSAWNGAVRGRERTSAPRPAPTPAPAPVRRPVVTPAPVASPAPIAQPVVEPQPEREPKAPYVHPMCKKKPWRCDQPKESGAA